MTELATLEKSSLNAPKPEREVSERDVENAQALIATAAVLKVVRGGERMVGDVLPGDPQKDSLGCRVLQLTREFAPHELGEIDAGLASFAAEFHELDPRRLSALMQYGLHGAVKKDGGIFPSLARATGQRVVVYGDGLQVDLNAQKHGTNSAPAQDEVRPSPDDTRTDGAVVFDERHILLQHQRRGETPAAVDDTRIDLEPIAPPTRPEQRRPLPPPEYQAPQQFKGSQELPPRGGPENAIRVDRQPARGRQTWPSASEHQPVTPDTYARPDLQEVPIGGTPKPRPEQVPVESQLAEIVGYVTRGTRVRGSKRQVLKTVWKQLKRLHNSPAELKDETHPSHRALAGLEAIRELHVDKHFFRGRALRKMVEHALFEGNEKAGVRPIAQPVHSRKGRMGKLYRIPHFAANAGRQVTQ